MARGGQNKLSPEQHRKRGNFRRDRHAEDGGTQAGLSPDEALYEPFLAGLAPNERHEGRYRLLCNMTFPREGCPGLVPVDIEAFQAWIIAYPGYYRASGRPWDVEEVVRVEALKRAVRWRRR